MRRLSESELECRRNDILRAMECGNYKLAARMLGITERQLYGRIRRLGIRGETSALCKAKKYEDEAKVMARVHDGMDDKSISLALGIPKDVVGKIRRNHGVMRYRGCGGRVRPDRWHLRAMMMSELYGKYTLSEIGDAFGCTAQNVCQIIRREREK